MQKASARRTTTEKIRHSMLRLSVAYIHRLNDQKADRTQALPCVKIVFSVINPRRGRFRRGLNNFFSLVMPPHFNAYCSHELPSSILNMCNMNVDGDGGQSFAGEDVI